MFPLAKNNNQLKTSIIKLKPFKRKFLETLRQIIKNKSRKDCGFKQNRPQDFFFSSGSFVTDTIISVFLMLATSNLDTVLINNNLDLLADLKMI